MTTENIEVAEITKVDVDYGVCYKIPDEFGDNYAFKEVRGIPITEEWLNKFGFEKESKNHWNIINPEYTTNWFYVLMKEGKYFIPYRWGKQVTGDRYMIYVHQLQNLYFALTGEELTIKNE